MPPIRTSPETAVKEGGVRKKMRKGTHSCSECRRRKIRCVFSAENPSVCVECFARGAKCIDQGHADSDVIVDQRKNLRERVARLEALVDSLMDEKDDIKSTTTLPHRGSQDIYGSPSQSDDAEPTPEVEDAPHAPLLSLFSNDILQRPTPAKSPNADGQPSFPRPDGTSPGPMFNVTCDLRGPRAVAEPQKTTSQVNQKAQRARQALLAALPPLEDVIASLTQDPKWWLLLQQKCRGTRTDVTVEMFARRVMAESTPCGLGCLVLCYAMTADGDVVEQCLGAVDRWIISDDEYMGTVEGLECAMILTKIYTDIGQARRAWLTCRRAVSFAQLMGLHRNHSASPDRDSIWWGLFIVDRMNSLLLGMPYAISDRHVNMDFHGRPLGQHSSRETFLAHLAVFAGKVIDITQALEENSYSAAMQLDQEMDNFLRSASEWWTGQTNVPKDAAAQLEWQEKLLSNLCFHQMRVYLHMPFMLKSTASSEYEYSRKTCLSAAREMLQFYHVLRAPDAPSYECKAVDFLGFTAAIVLILGLLGYAKIGQHDPSQDDSDWRLVEASVDIFKRASTERGGKVAEQSYKALEQLMEVRNFDSAYPASDPNTHAKIAIPFLGTISVQRGKNFDHHASHAMSSASSKTTPGSTTCSGPLTPATSIGSLSDKSNEPNPAQPNQNMFDDYDITMDPFIPYDGMYPRQGPFDGTNHRQQNFNHTPSANSLASTWPITNGFLWENVGQMDIDQDWNWFMNDPLLQSSSGLGQSF